MSSQTIAEHPLSDSNSSRSAREADAIENRPRPSFSIDEQSIERQLERARRWRYTKWPQSAKRTPQPAVVVKVEADQPGRAARLFATVSWLTFLWQAFPGATASAIVHAALFIALATIALVNAETRKEGLFVIADATPNEVIELDAIEIEIATPSLQDSESIAQKVTVEGLPDPDKMVGALPAVAASSRIAKNRAGPMGDARALFGIGGAGMSTLDKPDEGGAEFFGVKASGRRFVFVVDSSRSMSGQRWADACRELRVSIGKLGEDREFCVIFFDSKARLMFDSTPAQLKLVPATPINIIHMRQWFATVELGFDTKPMSAMKQALKLRPDAIYLLSDGEFRDKTALYLKLNNKINEDGVLKMPGVPIHTICFHSRDSQRTLRHIADANGGTYRFVPDPLSKRVASQRK